MLYVENILLPDEKITHYAQVHYVLYTPGVFMLLVAIFTIYLTPDIAAALQLAYSTQETVRSVTKFVSGGCFLAGIALLLRAWIDIYSTEVVVTNRRILVKVGISTATTAEIDRRRISSVIVTKPFFGRILNYGWVDIFGYSGDIKGLPVLTDPHALQKHIYNTAPIAE